MSAIAIRQQLIEMGKTPAAIKAALKSGRWQRLNEHVVCMHSGGLTVDEAREAVLASCASLVCLAGLTALAVHGVKGFETCQVHVLVEKSARVLPVVGVDMVMHEVRNLTAAHVYTRRGFAVTGVARSLIDAAVWSSDARTGARILAAGVQQRRVRPRDLEREAMRRRRMRHGAVLRPFIADLAGGAQALSEVEFLRFCRRHGFPRPQLNVRCDSTGRRRYLDAEFRRPDGTIVRAEIDGGIHLSLAQRLVDTRHDNDDVIDRKQTLRFLSIQIYGDDPIAVEQLRRVLFTG